MRGQPPRSWMDTECEEKHSRDFQLEETWVGALGSYLPLMVRCAHPTLANDELEEFRTESGKLKNQQVTVRRLEERNRALEEQVNSQPQTVNFPPQTVNSPPPTASSPLQT
eukprot:7272368-Pyramimonas_sp.AAC.1